MFINLLQRKLLVLWCILRLHTLTDGGSWNYFITAWEMSFSVQNAGVHKYELYFVEVPGFGWGLQGPTVLPLTNTVSEAILPSPTST